MGVEQALTGEAVSQIVHIGVDVVDGSTTQTLLSDSSVLEVLASGFGDGGVSVVGHDAKELMRSLLPLGVDITGLAMDTAVVAYLLDPSVDRYRLGDLAERFLGLNIDGGAGGTGQGGPSGRELRAPNGQRVPTRPTCSGKRISRRFARPPSSLDSVHRLLSRWPTWPWMRCTTRSSSPWSGCWPGWRSWGFR